MHTIPQRNCLPEHLAADAHLQPERGDDIDTTAKQHLKVILEPAGIEQTPSWLKIHEQVDVARLIRLTTRDRADDSDVPRAMLRGDASDLLTPRYQ